jgi:hypothetical protein
MNFCIICRAAGLCLILCIISSILLPVSAQQPHQRLGVRLDAKPTELRKAYRRKVRSIPLLICTAVSACYFLHLLRADTAPPLQRSPWSCTRISTRPTRKPGPQGSASLLPAAVASADRRILASPPYTAFLQGVCGAGQGVRVPARLRRSPAPGPLIPTALLAPAPTHPPSASDAKLPASENRSGGMPASEKSS